MARPKKNTPKKATAPKATARGKAPLKVGFFCDIIRRVCVITLSYMISSKDVSFNIFIQSLLPYKNLIILMSLLSSSII